MLTNTILICRNGVPVTIGADEVMIFLINVVSWKDTPGMGDWSEMVKYTMSDMPQDSMYHQCARYLLTNHATAVLLVFLDDMIDETMQLFTETNLNIALSGNKVPTEGIYLPFPIVINQLFANIISFL